jgi:hypothetical protein
MKLVKVGNDWINLDRLVVARPGSTSGKDGDPPTPLLYLFFAVETSTDTWSLMTHNALILVGEDAEAMKRILERETEKS